MTQDDFIVLNRPPRDRTRNTSSTDFGSESAFRAIYESDFFKVPRNKTEAIIL